MKEPVKLWNDYMGYKELSEREVTLGEYKLMKESRLRLGGLSNLARNMELAMGDDDRYNSITVLLDVPFKDSVDGVIDIAYDSNKQSIAVMDNSAPRDNMRLTQERVNMLRKAGIINEDGSQTKAQQAIFDLSKNKDHLLSKDLDLLLNVVGSEDVLRNRLNSVKATGAQNLEKSDGVSKEEISNDLSTGEITGNDSPTREEQIEKSIAKSEGATIGGKRVIKTVEIQSKDQASDIFKDSRSESGGDIILVQLEDNQYRLVSDKGNGSFEEIKDYSVNELGKTLNNEYNQVLVQPRDIEMGDDSGYSSLTPDDNVITFKNSSSNESIENGNSEHVEVGLDGSVKKFNVIDENDGIVIVDDSTGLKEPYVANFGGKEKVVTTQAKLDEMTGANEDPDKAQKIQNDMKEENIAGQKDMIYLQKLVQKRQEMIKEVNKGESADLGKVNELAKDIESLSGNSNGVSVETKDVMDKAKEIEIAKAEKIQEAPEKVTEKEKEEVEEAEEDKERTPWGDAEARRNNPYA